MRPLRDRNGWTRSCLGGYVSIRSQRGMCMSRGVISLAATIDAVSAVAACSRDPQKIKLAAVAKGDSYAVQRKYGEAIIEYRKAIAADPMYGPARLKLGTAYENVGEK